MAQDRPFSNFDAALVISCLRDVGPCSFAKLLKKMDGDLSHLLSLSLDDLVFTLELPAKIAVRIRSWRDFVDLDGQLSAIEAFGSKFIPVFSPDYPEKLKNMRHAPIGIHCAGKWLSNGKSVAIVGTRRCSFAGEKIANELGRALAENGIATISGLAKGIDAAAHIGTLAAGGHTVAVLGCGLDVVYPPENAELYKIIRRNGTLVSEFPFGRRADRMSFAIRNRIIAGLADAIVVVESPKKGGSMLSAQRAVEQGKPLFAVVGKLSQTNGGCVELVKSGTAVAIDSVEQLLVHLENPPVRPVCDRQCAMRFDEKKTEKPPHLRAVEGKIWDALGERGPCAVDAIAAELSIGVLECAMLVQGLCIRGILRRDPSGAFCII